MSGNTLHDEKTLVKKEKNMGNPNKRKYARVLKELEEKNKRKEKALEFFKSLPPLPTNVPLAVPTETLEVVEEKPVEEVKELQEQKVDKRSKAYRQNKNFTG